MSVSGVSATEERWAEQIMQIAQHIAQLKAKQLWREQRQRLRSKEQERCAAARRRTQVGEALERAGFGGWEIPEIVGALLQASDAIGQSPTMRMAARRRGELHLNPVHMQKPKAQGRVEPPAPAVSDADGQGQRPAS